MSNQNYKNLIFTNFYFVAILLLFLIQNTFSQTSGNLGLDVWWRKDVTTDNGYMKTTAVFTTLAATDTIPLVQNLC